MTFHRCSQASAFLGRKKESTRNTPITIIGGGVGGLTLARVLHVHGIAAAVYEAEAPPDARGQGGLLDIHEYNGQLALKAAGLFEEFRGLIQAEAEAQYVLDKDANVLLFQPDKGNGGRPEVPRGELRRILLESLPEGTVRWGHKVEAVSSLGDGRHEVIFTNGSAVTAEVLVGADGAWSRVRSLLSDAKPGYVGTAFIETFLFDSDRRHKASAEAVGSGTMMALAPGKGIIAHREAEATLHAYVALNKPVWMRSSASRGSWKRRRRFQVKVVMKKVPFMAVLGGFAMGRVWG